MAQLSVFSFSKLAWWSKIEESFLQVINKHFFFAPPFLATNSPVTFCWTCRLKGGRKTVRCLNKNMYIFLVRAPLYPSNNLFKHGVDNWWFTKIPKESWEDMITTITSNFSCKPRVLFLLKCSQASLGTLRSELIAFECPVDQYQA